MNKNVINTLSWIGVIILTYFTVFHKLGSAPINTWDESLFALRALHYIDFGRYMEDFYNYYSLIEHRNTKLPFTTFLQVISMKSFGNTALALRLPNVFLFLTMSYFFFQFCKRELGNKWLGIIFFLSLISTHSWINTHLMRNGSQDIAFAVYLFGALVSFFCYEYYGEKFKWSLPLFTILIIAAALTKNILAFIPGISLVLYLLYRQKLLMFLKRPAIWLSIVFIFGAYLTTIFYFEYKYSGFIDRMWSYELGGRYVTMKENTGPWYLYIHQLTFKYNTPFFLFTFLGIFLIFKAKLTKPVKNLGILLLIHSIVYLIVITASISKCNWYDAPIVPAFMFIGAIGVIHLWQQIQLRFSKNKFVRLGLCGLIILAFAIPYVNTAYKISTLGFYTKEDGRLGEFLMRLPEKKPNHRSYWFHNQGWPTTYIWYIEKMRKKGIDIRPIWETDFAVNDTVISAFHSSKKILDDKFHYSILYEEPPKYRLIQIDSLK